MSGRLFTELRDRRGLAYQVGVLGTYRTGPTFLLTYMGTAPANVEASEKGVLAEIERIRTEPVTERELARAKAYLLGNLTMDRRTTRPRRLVPGVLRGDRRGLELPRALRAGGGRGDDRRRGPGRAARI